jgi:hypothetical protein
MIFVSGAVVCCQSLFIFVRIFEKHNYSRFTIHDLHDLHCRDVEMSRDDAQKEAKSDDLLISRQQLLRELLLLCLW